MQRRWEYRVWSVEPPALKAQAERMAGTPEQRTDTYFLLPGPEIMPKLRGQERLECKRRCEVTDDGFEQWAFGGSHPFPLEPATVEAMLGFAPASDLKDPDGLAAAAHGRDLPTMRVAKTRWRWEEAGIPAEVTAVVAGGQRAWTVALEAEDLEATRHVAAMLDLTAGRNQSYRDWLGGLAQRPG
jgi:hypothetical protein